MRPGAEGMTEMQHAVALLRRQFFPIVVVIVVLGYDAAGYVRHLFAQRIHMIRVARSCRPRWAIGRAVSQSGARTAQFRYETSNIPSTSTAASAGRAATPTVVRAWRPLSPKAATIRSDAPFSTFGPSRKSGA